MYAKYLLMFKQFYLSKIQNEHFNIYMKYNKENILFYIKEFFQNHFNLTI